MKEARDKLNQFIRTYPNGRHIVAAREELARLQIHCGDFAGAEATIAALAAMPKAGEKAAVLRTKVLARQGKHDAGHRRAGPPDRLVSQGVRSGSAPPCWPRRRAWPPRRSTRRPRTLVRQVIQANPPEDAASQAPAYNTLGDCLRAANRPKEALIAYLHTDMLYSKDKEEHPRALHSISLMFRQLKQDARADEFAQRLRLEYPRSVWNRASSSEER